MQAIKHSVKATIASLPKILLYDTLFYLSLFLTGFFFIKSLEKKSSTVSLNEQLAATNPVLAKEMLGQAQHLIISILLALLLFIIAVIIATTLFKGSIWLRIENKKPRKSYFTKLLKINSIWIVSWTILFFAMLFLFKAEAVPFYLIGLMVLFWYLTNILYATAEDKKPIRKTLSLGFSKLHTLGIKFIVLIVILFIVLKTFQYFQFHVIILFIFAALYIAWARIYFHEKIRAA